MGPFLGAGWRMTPFATLDRLAQLATEARYANPRLNSVMGSPPAISQSLGATAGLTNTYTWNGARAGVFNFYGGYPTSDGVGGAKFTSTTVGGVYSSYCWRLETVVDAVIVTYKLLDISGAGKIRFIVDGHYVSTTPYVPAVSGYVYVTLDFTGVGDRATRNIIIEGMNTNFDAMYVLPTETLSKPGGKILRAVIVGDSFTASGGMSSNFTGFAQILGDYLGIRDLWNLGVGSTGYLADASGTQLTFRGRLSDITTADPDLIILAGGHNDTPYTAAAITAEVLAYLAAIRSISTAPIIVLGVLGGAVALATTRAVETAIASAVTQFNDASTHFLADVTSSNGPLITGTGNTSAPNSTGNSDIYIGTDTIHPNDLGHEYHARYLADQIMTLISSGAANG